MKVEIYVRRSLLRKRRFGWRLRAENGQVIATDGGQGYEREADAIQTLRSIRHPTRGISSCAIYDSSGRKVERWPDQ